MTPYPLPYDPRIRYPLNWVNSCAMERGGPLNPVCRTADHRELVDKFKTASPPKTGDSIFSATMKPSPAISRILLYVRDLQQVADFYVRHFGFVERPRRSDDLIELKSSGGDFSLLLHQASKGHRIGQSCVKIIFDVDDIEEFKKISLKKGLEFGMTYKGDGYEFANARDPAKNPIQISRRAFLP